MLLSLREQYSMGDWGITGMIRCLEFLNSITIRSVV